MPAEGLPWLQRDEILTYEEIERIVALLAVDGRARRAPHRRRAARAPRAVAPGRDALAEPGRPRPVADHQRLPARAPGRAASSRAGLRRVNVSLDALAPDRFFQLTRRDSLKQVLDGLAAAERHPELRPIKVNVVALKDFTEDEVRALRGVRRASTRTRSASSSSCRSTATARGRATACCPTRRSARLIHAAYPLKDLGRERHGTSRRWEFADGAGLDRLHLPGHGAVLRRLQPHPRDRRGQAAHLPVLDDRDRPARAAARRRVATTSSSRSSATPCGRRSSSTTSTTRASCQPRALDVADRRMKDFEEALALDPRGDRAAREPRPSRWPRRAAARDRRRGAARAIDLPPFDRTAMDGYAVRAADVARRRGADA